MANIRLRLRPQPEKQVSPPRPAHPVGRVRLQLPSAPPWRAHYPFSLCWRHAQASPPAGACRRPVAAMRACAGPRAAGIAAEGRSEDPPRAGGRVATSTPPVSTSVETGGSSHWTAPMDRGKPLHNSRKGLEQRNDFFPCKSTVSSFVGGWVQIRCRPSRPFLLVNDSVAKIAIPSMISSQHLKVPVAPDQSRESLSLCLVLASRARVHRPGPQPQPPPQSRNRCIVIASARARYARPTPPPVNRHHPSSHAAAAE